MTDELGFIEAICKSPDGDLPRLVYADWLDEHDRPERAEFIRVQCRIAEMDNSHRLDHEEEANRDCPCEWCALRRRERELWMGREWWALPTGIHVDFTAHIDQTRPATPYNHAVYRRGFLDELTCDAESWLRVGDSLTWGWAGCGRCVNGQVYPSAGSSGGLYLSPFPCQQCSGSGRVPPTMACDHSGNEHARMRKRGEDCAGRVARPCPPTAQPVTTARLTGDPVAMSQSSWGQYAVAANGTFTSDRWPGVTFHLPTG